MCTLPSARSAAAVTFAHTVNLHALQTLAHGLSSSRSSQQQEPPGSTAQQAPRQQPSGLSHTTDRLMPRQQHDQPSLRAATQRAEQGLQQHGEQVQGQMHSMQDTLQGVCQSLQSLQAAFQQPPATAQTQSKVRLPISSENFLRSAYALPCMARDWKHVAWQIHMLWVLCCGDMLHWAGDGNELAYCIGECTQHLEVRHAFGSCSKHGVCARVYV